MLEFFILFLVQLIQFTINVSDSNGLPDTLDKTHPGGSPSVARTRALLYLTIVRHQHAISLLAVCEHRTHRTSVAPFGLLYYTANVTEPSLVSSLQAVSIEIVAKRRRLKRTIGTEKSRFK